MKRTSVILMTLLLITIVTASASYGSQPGVTINQWSGQQDPVRVAPVKFRAVFTQPVFDFTAGDVVVTSNIPGAKTVTVTEVPPPGGNDNDGTTYDVVVSGTFSASGMVSVSIPANRAENGAGEKNLASVSTDNTVTYDVTMPTSVVNLENSPPGPTNETSFTFNIIFSEFVVTATKKDPGPDGEAGTADDGPDVADLNAIVNISGSGTTGIDATKTTFTGAGAQYRLSITIDPAKLDKPEQSTITVNTVTGAGTDLAGNTSTASTGQDNTVVLDFKSPSMTVNQAQGQQDPTNTQPIYFTALFSEPVVGFTADDITVNTGTVTLTEVNPFDGTKFSIAVSGVSSAGDVTISVDADKVTDRVGNSGLASSSVDDTVTYKPTARSVTITQATGQADPTGALPINFRAQFTSSVSGFDSSDVVVSGSAGATSATVSGSGSLYNIAINSVPKAGTVIIKIPADAVTEGNLPSIDSDNIVSYDNVVPFISSLTRGPAQASPTNSKPITFRVVFSESVNGFDGGDVVISGTAPGVKTATVTEVAPFDGTTYDLAVTGMSSSGSVVASIAASTVSDPAGNTNPASGQATVSYDVTPPTIVVSQPATQIDPTNVAQVNFSVTFSEPVTGFAATDVTVSGTTGANAVSLTGAGTSYNVSVTGMINPGVVSISIPAGVAVDVVGNGNTASTSTDNTVTYVPSPTVTINQASGQLDPALTQPINFTAVFSKPVDGFTEEDVIITGTAGFDTKLIFITNSGDYKTYAVSVYGMITPGTVIASINAGAARDASLGFLTSDSTSTDNTVTYQPVQPTVTVEQSADQTDPTNEASIDFRVTFSVAVTGFTASDVLITGTAGGTKTATVTGSGTTYNVAVSGMTSSGTVIVNVPENAAIDSTLISNTASTSVDNTVAYDATSPTVTINQASGQADPTTAEPINFTAVFSEPVLGFTSADVVLSGTASAATTTVTEIVPFNKTRYTVSVTGISAGGTLSASIRVGAVTDLTGNLSIASTSSDNSVTIPLGVIITQAVGQADPSNQSTIRFKASFGEPVSDFDANDVLIDGTAGATSVTVTGSGKSYEIAVTGMTQPGTVIVDIPADAAHNSNNDGNLASTNTDNTVTFDNQAPTVLLEKANGQSDPTNGSTIVFTATFSEPITGFGPSDVVIGGGTGTTIVRVIDSGDHTEFTVSVTGMTQSGTLTAIIPAGAVIDGAGNGNTASETASVGYNNSTLRVTVNQADTQSDPTNQLPINFTVVFNAAVSDFASGDVTISGTAGGIKTATVTGSGTTYNIAVNGAVGQGTVIASIAAGRAHDAANNANVASTATDNTVNYDIVKPTVTFARAASQASPAQGSPVNFTATFSETVTGFTASDVLLQGTANPTIAAITGSGTTYNVAVSGMNQSGTIVATIPADSAQDGVGNQSTASASVVVNYERVGPSVAISLAPGLTNPTKNTTINLTAVFSSAVSDFVSSDVVVTGTSGGTKAATVTGSGSTYNIAVVGMTSSGTVIVTIPAGCATNADGDANLVSSRTVAFDNVAPTVAITAPTAGTSINRNCAAISISGTASDSSGLSEVTYSTGHSGEGTLTGTSAWSGSITINGISDTITVTATDAVGNTSTDTLVVNVVATSPGSAWSGLAMVSIPIIPDSTDPKDVVDFDSNGWVSFVPDSGTYSVYPNSSTWFAPVTSAIGRGFWARFSGTVDTPCGTIPSQSAEGVIKLRPGWNLIGTPFISSVRWNSAAIQVETGAVRRPLVSANDAVKNFAWGWDAAAGDYYLVNDTSATPNLMPWQAYWVKAMINCNLIVPAP